MLLLLLLLLCSQLVCRSPNWLRLRYHATVYLQHVCHTKAWSSLCDQAGVMRHLTHVVARHLNHNGQDTLEPTLVSTSTVQQHKHRARVAFNDICAVVHLTHTQTHTHIPF